MNDYETKKALLEGEMNEYVDSYFKYRPHLKRDIGNEKLLESG